MLKHIALLTSALIIIAGLSGCALTADASEGKQPPYRIGKDDLLKMMDDPDVLVMDVRAPEHWSRRATMIRGAQRYAPDRFDSWSSDLPADKKFVLYCD